MDDQITEVIGWLGFALVSMGYYFITAGYTLQRKVELAEILGILQMEVQLQMDLLAM